MAVEFGGNEREGFVCGGCVVGGRRHRFKVFQQTLGATAPRGCFRPPSPPAPSQRGERVLLTYNE
jgi:hypothetical protein